MIHWMTVKDDVGSMLEKKTKALNDYLHVDSSEIFLI